MQQRRMSGVMRMYEKLKTLKDKLQKMKTNRANRQIGQTFHFSPFSRKQKQVLTWWCKESPVHDMDGVIADGAIRSGKTISMSLSFVMWAMSTFTGQNFAMCGKTIGSFRRNVLFWLKLMLRSRGYSITDHRADNLLTIQKDGKENYFYIFGGKDERSQDLIQGITLAGVFFDEVALMPESFVNQATGRCSVKGSKFWFNCNPDGPYHWFKQNWIDKSIGYLGKEETERIRQQAAAEGKDPGLKDILYLHFTMDDNLSLDEEIPCMSDESFGGNVSGVAMEFKLLGMENITKIKTRYYKKGLRKRVRIFCNYLALHGISIDPSGITMTFTRALPKNLLEISQIVANLWGKVSRKTLLSQVPFVDDVDEELKALETEEEENLKRQREVFGLQDNTPPEQDSDDKEKVDE